MQSGILHPGQAVYLHCGRPPQPQGAGLTLAFFSIRRYNTSYETGSFVRADETSDKFCVEGNWV